MACSSKNETEYGYNSERSPILRTISAEVSDVTEKFLILTSSQLETESILRVSLILARSLLTNFCESMNADETPNSFDEFFIGDRLMLDVYRDDDDDYIPMRVRIDFSINF